MGLLDKPLKYWNYRVVRHNSKIGVVYTIREVYYTSDKDSIIIDSWTGLGINPMGDDTPSSLFNDLMLQLQAFTKPVLLETVEEGEHVLVEFEDEAPPCDIEKLNEILKFSLLEWA